MKVLVTGGAGFIGSHVVDLYLEQGYQVVVVDDLSTGRASNLNPAATFYRMDIRSPELAGVFETEQPDYVNHHAAQIDVRRSVAEPLFDAEVNILGSLNVIECARRQGVKRLVYASTGGAVYDEPAYLPCDEEHPVRPICQYGISKCSVEQYLEMYLAMYGLSYTVLRYANVYGPRQDPLGEAGVVAIFTGAMLGERPVTVHGDGRQERDFVHVADCARANGLALEAGRDGVYNLGSGRGTTINELFGRLKEMTGYEADANYGPAKQGETYRIYLSAEKAENEMGWRPEIDLQEGLADTVAYFRKAEVV